MIDPLGYVLTTIRSDAVVAGLTTRIRGGEPAPGDALSPGSFQRFVVLTRLGAVRYKRAGAQWVRIGVRAYGTTYQDAAALYGAVSDAVHNVGPRKNASGVLIYRSFDDTGGSAEKDPDTGQPVEVGVLSVAAADRLVS